MFIYGPVSPLVFKVRLFTFCFLLNPPHSGCGFYLSDEMTLPKITDSHHLPNLVMACGRDSCAFSPCTSSIHSPHTSRGNLFKNGWNYVTVLLTPSPESSHYSYNQTQTPFHGLQGFLWFSLCSLSVSPPVYVPWYSRTPSTLAFVRPLEWGKPSAVLGLCTCLSLCLECFSLRGGWFLYKIQISAQMLPHHRTHPWPSWLK